MTKKDHYTDTELAEFKGLLDAKLAEANADLKILNTTLEHVSNDTKGDDFAGDFERMDKYRGCSEAPGECSRPE